MTQLDMLIGAWTSRYEADLLLEILDKNDIPSCKVYTAADCAQDAQYRARGMVRDVPDKHFGSEIGRASCRERVCQYVEISVVAVSLKKKNTTSKRHNVASTNT